MKNGMSDDRKGDNKASFDITVFERGHASCWNLNSNSQETVPTRADGVDLPSIQRLGSDMFCLHKVKESKQLYYLPVPRPVLENSGISKDQIGLDERSLEKERNKMIDGLMEALGPNITVRHDCFISGVERDENDGIVNFVGCVESFHGKFDIAVDINVRPSRLEDMNELVLGSDNAPVTIGKGDALPTNLSPGRTGMSGRGYTLKDAADLASDLLEKQQMMEKFMQEPDEENDEEYILKTQLDASDFNCTSDDALLGRPLKWLTSEAVCNAAFSRIITIVNRYVVPYALMLYYASHS